MEELIMISGLSSNPINQNFGGTIIAKGLEQTAGYMDTAGAADEGHLMLCDGRQTWERAHLAPTD